MSEIGRYRIIAPLCYQGKEGCEDVRCTRAGFTWLDDGSVELGACIGYHCSYCDEPCSSQGHRCPASLAMIEAATKIADERGRP